MILTDTMRDLVSPNRSASDEFGAVPFAKGILYESNIFLSNSLAVSSLHVMS